MKIKLYTFAVGLFIISNIFAQEIKVKEPDFIGETLLLFSDSTSLLLQRESATIKIKSNAGQYLTGIGKVKLHLSLAGVKSVNPAIVSSPICFIVKAKDNSIDPNSFISIFKFDIYKNKERRYQVAERSTFSEVKINHFSFVKFKAKKYGKSSYLVLLDNLPSGEYGMLLMDTKNTDKNDIKITTFSVE